MKSFAPLFLLATVALLSGCVSSKYKLARAETPSAIPLTLAAVQPPVEVMLNTVIVYQGPGSWKREAYWDEYVLTVAHRGVGPLTIESAELTGLADRASLPGAEPWALEKQSRALRDAGFGLAKDAAVQIGGGIASVAAGAAAGAGAFTLAFGTGWGVGAAGAAIVGAVALPAFIGGSIYANISHRHEVEREFQRHRLALPASLVAGQIVQGSLFFPITPGPKHLTLRCRVDGLPQAVVLDLAPLSGLHLKATPHATVVTTPSSP